MDMSQLDSVSGPTVVVLGVAQDGGYPQAGCHAACCEPAWKDPERRALIASLGVVDPDSGSRWMIDASPDFPDQLYALDQIQVPRGPSPNLTGIVLTHAHIGHYTGLMYLGREAIGAHAVPVWGMPRMRSFLKKHGPWAQLCRLGNIELRELETRQELPLAPKLSLRAFSVPHRGEYSETVGVVISGPNKKLLYLPDIDSWERNRKPIEALLDDVDIALVDGTFFDASELPHRERGEIPHPLVCDSIERFSKLSVAQRSRIFFCHFNHSNPLLHPDSTARKMVQDAGLGVAHTGMCFSL